MIVFDRRTILRGALATAAAIALPTTGIARPAERFRELCGIPSSVAMSPWHTRLLPFWKTKAKRRAEQILLGSRWHYESLTEGWGAIRHMPNGFAFVTLPSEYWASWERARMAYPLVGPGDTKEAAETAERYAYSSAAAQAATWAEEVGGGALYLSFPDRGTLAGPDGHYMACESAPPLVAVDGSRGSDDFLLYS